MKHDVIGRLAAVMLPALTLIGAAALWLLLQSQQQLVLAQQTRFDYFESANQIRLLSGQLSARIRNYVTTGSERDLSLYYHVLAVTEGRHARLNGKTLSNEQMLQNMELTREELSLLERARQATLTLARLEEEAVRLMASGREHQARQKVFNPDYDRYSEIMSDSVNQFITLLLERLERNIQREQRHNRLTMAVLAGLLLLMMAASLWLGWRLRDRGETRRRLSLAGYRGRD
ncbi:chemotaxis protein [Oceanimonas sp. MB9]|uniref:chemotaxis protein n=1 Tax=Oceanimonas sp. MB9 TaxID=2588453 RepID=UPI0013F66DBF|nr:chemotaxis protein [Oceanimonas sp. MB9]NHI01204.1 hypothetical protein [Oceanimonas sp. MB9]